VGATGQRTPTRTRRASPSRSREVGHRLTALHTTWTDTRAAVQQAQAPEPILQHVIALLETVARAHPQVLPEPPPRACFMGYGDSAIDFTLFAWPDHFHHWLQVKSDLTTSVYEAVSAAGMSFPLPQREVRVLPEAEAALAPVNAAYKTERADT
jgi:small-conductance mechanosensitive channel